MFALWLLWLPYFRPISRPNQPWLESVPGCSTTSQVWAVCVSRHNCVCHSSNLFCVMDCEALKCSLVLLQSGHQCKTTQSVWFCHISHVTDMVCSWGFIWNSPSLHHSPQQYLLLGSCDFQLGSWIDSAPPFLSRHQHNGALKPWNHSLHPVFYSDPLCFILTLSHWCPQVLRVLANIAYKERRSCVQLAHLGLLPALCATLKMADREMVTLSMDVLFMLVVSDTKVHPFKTVQNV